MCSWCWQRSEEDIRSPGLELQTVVWELGTELRSSARATSAADCWAIPSAPLGFLFQSVFMGFFYKLCCISVTVFKFLTYPETFKLELLQRRVPCVTACYGAGPTVGLMPRI